MLAISTDDQEKTDILTIIFEIVEGALLLKIGEEVVPTMLHWLVNEVVIRRYQMLGSEHLLSEGIDVISSTFKRGDLFDDYLDYIYNYINNVQAKTESGKLVSNKKLRML